MPQCCYMLCLLQLLYSTGGMPDSAICRFRKVLPAAGRPDAAATAALLKQMEQGGQLGYTGLLDASQMAAIATAILKPLALLHGPPGTGKVGTGVKEAASLRAHMLCEGRQTHRYQWLHCRACCSHTRPLPQSHITPLLPLLPAADNHHLRPALLPAARAWVQGQNPGNITVQRGGGQHAGDVHA